MIDDITCVVIFLDKKLIARNIYPNPAEVLGLGGGANTNAPPSPARRTPSPLDPADAATLGPSSGLMLDDILNEDNIIQEEDENTTQ